ncbi:hypothetical protein [Roseateles saccharophilus]|uniref:DUF4124 domain-containing protein n=1 Tax=Roseateles saccharophilus TaxID=304 RepID=A0A4R3UTW6_ROSSA|nr:hypothetical protein [Roseateles saccharophilus]MDG0833268.1 hypothetical protein [Roseateles saccharophilus]TCU94381.1 hypothetical protein EV671_101726 [Roseateles saccharophilus]
MKTLLLALAAITALPTLAQSQVRHAQVYRCGPDGRDLRDSPCPGGPAASGAIRYDEPSAADSRAARERHLADARQAAALASARRASEAEARHQRSQAVGLQTLPPPAQAASAPRVVHLKPPKLARPHKPKPAASSAR